MNIVLMGPSGAGKGTQAVRLADQLHMVHLSPGDLFRDNVLQRTNLGQLAQEYMLQGGLVPDAVTDGMIWEYLQQIDPEKGIIFDGFPRSLYQIQTLEEMLNETGRTLDGVVYLDVSDDEVLHNRLPGRVTCSACQKPFHEKHYPPRLCDRPDCSWDNFYKREDDTLELGRARLHVFHRQSISLIDRYDAADKLFIVNGEQPIPKVTQSILEALEMLLERQNSPTYAADLARIRALKPQVLALSYDEVTNNCIDVVLLGAPGSGKGTQAQYLRQQFSLKHIATGDIFRENIRGETELGLLAKSYIDRGQLVPDEVTEALVRDRLSQADTDGGTILDGFPRNLSQAEALDEIMTSLGRRIDGVIYIRVAGEEILERLSGRVICRKCLVPFHRKFNPFTTCPYEQCDGEYLYQRDDDKPETVSRRLITYHRQTAPLIDYYRARGVLLEIDGIGPVEEITRRIMDVAENLNRTLRTSGAD